MAKKKRLTRKELLKGPDEFVSFSARAIQFAVDNQRPLSYTLGGLFVIVLALTAFRYFSGLSERKAYALFDQGLVPYLEQVSGKGTTPFEQVAKDKFDEVLKKYSSTKAAQLSLPLYADMSYREGSYDKAIELYERALKGFSQVDSPLQRLIWNGLGYSYEGKEDYKSASQYFQKITDSEGDFLKADAYFNLGRMFEAINNPKKAREAYSSLVKDYPGSANVQIAEERILRLKEQG